jgi:aminoglycoside phosphotransferase (APT) family kinase protein
VFSDRERDRLRDEAHDLASAVSGGVRPSLRHRDLHLDNLRAGDDGRLVALLDFDGAEAWDRAVDMVEPRWQVSPYYPGARETFDRAYFDGDAPPERWELRVRLVAPLELVNAVANARTERDSDYEQRARDQLATLAEPGA